MHFINKIFLKNLRLFKIEIPQNQNNVQMRQGIFYHLNRGYGTSKNNYSIMEFNNQLLWRQWLDKNHKNFDGVWLKIAKKESGLKTVSYADAVDMALCYGWIDGQRKKQDEDYFLQKFTPRREKSIWSKKNIENIERLSKEGRIMPAGHAEVQRAKKDGRWQASYDSQAMVVPQDFLEEVRKSKKALAFYETLSRSSLFSICLQLQTAKKPETRAKRFDKLLQMLINGEKPA